jgi:hypothetical protein
MQREMFAGHYGLSFLVGNVEPRLRLWTLFLATQLLDILWAIFVLLGIERYRIVLDITASLPLDLYYTIPRAITCHVVVLSHCGIH